MKFYRFVLGLLVLFPFLLAGAVVSGNQATKKALDDNHVLAAKSVQDAQRIEFLETQLQEKVDQLDALGQQIATDERGSAQREQQLYDQAVALQNQLRRLGVRPIVTVAPPPSSSPGSTNPSGTPTSTTVARPTPTTTVPSTTTTTSPCLLRVINVC